MEAGLCVAGVVGRPGRDQVVARGGVPVPGPLPPAVDAGDLGQLSDMPWALSICTSTASMPLCCAHATPATVTVPVFSGPFPVGTSIRDSVLIGACWDQPRWAQYA